MTFLCALEAVNLDNLFSDCQDLSTIRGGGLAVLNIADEVARALHAEKISGGASQGLLRIEGASAEDVEARVRNELARLDLLDHATVMVSACEEVGGQFPRQRAELKARMRWSQMRSPSVIYPALGGSLVCDIDKVRPARRRPDLERKQNQSDFSYERRGLGRAKKKGLVQELLGEMIPEKFEVVSEFAELADDDEAFGNLRQKIAVLRFDGNDFGEVARSCSTPEMEATFSERTRSQQRGFFRSLLAFENGSPWWTAEGPRKLRMEIVVYGGDEVMFITPAWLGWKALEAFYQQAAAWPELQGFGRMTYSAGIVFCHHNAPIHAVKRLASELADQAKDRAKELKGGKGDFAVYQVLESFDAVGQDLDEFLQERYAFSGGAGMILGLEEIGILEGNMDYWRSTLSKRKLYSLVLGLARGIRPDRDKAIQDLVESKSAQPERVAEPLKRLHDRLGDAAFLHVLELWDYTGVHA